MTTKTRMRSARARSGPAHLRGERSETAPGADAGAAAEAAAGGQPRLRIKVENGNLKFVREPLMIGHYRSVRLTGTEKVMNALMGGVLKAALDVGAYPDAPGTSAVFVNTRVSPDDPSRLPRPAGVVVVGLGDEAKLCVADLTNTVRQGVLAVVRRFAEQPGAPATVRLATTLIGSGGTGISAGQAALAVAQGVRDANARLAAGGRWPLVTDLRLVEMFRDRASEAWRALQLLSVAEPEHYAVAEYVVAGTGAIDRPSSSSYRGADYDFVTVEMRSSGAVAYTLDMRRARHEVRAQATQGRLVQDLVKTASSGQVEGIGGALFQLLVPVEMEPFLAATTDLQISLDHDTAAIPWELLDPGQGDGRSAEPWSIRTKLIRNLRTSVFREGVTDAGVDASVLVVGEPRCTDPVYPRLEGARAEARAVVSRLRALGDDRVKALIAPDDADGPDAVAVTTALLERPWRIVHVAGHGKQPDTGEPGGVVLSNGTFLGPREIHCMRVVPELVFVNCCHLGSMDDPRVLGAASRSEFAANVAEGLIREGVRCVVAAGWAVEDEAAQAFATAFYDALLADRTFGEAVVAARKAARATPWGADTWAAYQCYGDRDWRLRRRGSEGQRVAAPAPPPTPDIPSFHELELALDRLATELGDGGLPDDERRTRIEELRGLEERYASRWGAVGRVAEALGAAFAAGGDPVRAIGWYRRAIAANDGTASLKALEQLGNLLAREAASRVVTARERAEKGDGARKELAEARRQVEEAITLLERLVALQPTLERESLCGSAYKRKALVEEAAGRGAEADAAIRKMREHYAAGLALARDAKAGEIFYPALNFVAADLVESFAAAEPRPLDAALVEEIRGCLEARNRDAPDFWSLAAVADLALYEALAARRLAGRKQEVLGAYADLHERAPAPWSWKSVRDQARFVLARYAQRSAPEEREATDAVLAVLDGYALGEITPGA